MHQGPLAQRTINRVLHGLRLTTYNATVAWADRCHIHASRPGACASQGRARNVRRIGKTKNAPTSIALPSSPIHCPPSDAEYWIFKRCLFNGTKYSGKSCKATTIHAWKHKLRNNYTELDQDQRRKLGRPWPPRFAIDGHRQCCEWLPQGRSMSAHYTHAHAGRNLGPSSWFP